MLQPYASKNGPPITPERLLGEGDEGQNAADPEDPLLSESEKLERMRARFRARQRRAREQREAMNG